MYSTITNIRKEAGFTGNTNILDADITSFQEAAYSHINGILSRTYTLPLSETPDILELIERRLAAGHLLLEQYGEEAEGTDREGETKVKWAEDMLAKIESGEIQLLNTSNEVLTRSEGQTMKGWPNSSTEDLDQDEAGGERIFHIKEEF